MLDSAEQAQQLCAMHGYGTSMQAGVPVALLIKVGLQVCMHACLCAGRAMLACIKICALVHVVVSAF